ncbi:MAG TPA: transglycosylase domain-containing protein, partial [Gemmatirosa sp.]
MAVSAPPRPVTPHVAPPAPAVPPPRTPGWWRERRARLRERLRPTGSRRAWARWHLLLVPALVALVAAVWAGDAWVFTCGFEGCPTAGDIRAFRPSEGGRILDRSGQPMGRVRLVRRVNVPLAAVPPAVRNAFVAIEDRRFYEHRGVDWRGGARALVANLRAGGVREGFSTITMQVVRNTFAVERQGERSVRRKLLELRLSRLLESTLTKDQILELYFNVIYLGNGVYGVEAASRDLFGRDVGQLTLAQAATLAALPKGPSAYTPRRFPARATRRRDLVLARMARDGYISDAAAERAAREPMRVTREGWTPEGQGNSYALDAVRQLVDSIKEANGIESNDLVVTTTLDAVAQAAAERAVRRRAAAIGSDVEGAMVAIDPRTGAVRALVGGIESGDDYARGSFNRATGAHRQPGSAFKPFVYATALAGGMTPATIVDDAPIEVDLGHGQVWRPSNSEGHYLGETTLREALAHSANAATVRVAERLGEPRIIRTARAAGIVSPLPEVPSMVLGSVEVTPMELVTAYAPFANGGFRVAPRLVARVATVDGTPLWTGDVRRTPALDARDAFLLTSMLRSV